MLRGCTRDRGQSASTTWPWDRRPRARRSPSRAVAPSWELRGCADVLRRPQAPVPATCPEAHPWRPDGPRRARRSSWTSEHARRRAAAQRRAEFVCAGAGAATSAIARGNHGTRRVRRRAVRLVAPPVHRPGCGLNTRNRPGSALGAALPRPASSPLAASPRRARASAPPPATTRRSPSGCRGSSRSACGRGCRTRRA